MPSQRFNNRIVLVLTLAALGVLLVWLPPRLLDQYERIQRIGPPWTYFYFGVVGLGSLILLGLTIGILWQLVRNTRRKEEARERRAKNPSQLSVEERRQEVETNLAAVADLQHDQSVSDELRRELETLTSRVELKQQAQRLEIVAFGTISSGKSSLLNALAGRDVFATDPRGGTTLQRQEIPWPGNDQVLLVDTPGLGEVEGQERLKVAADSARDADLVLLVVDGPLRQSEFQLVSRLGEMEKRILVCLNKQDWYEDHDRETLIGQIAEQVSRYIDRDDILAVRSRVTERMRTRVLADGRETEEAVPVPADISALAERMMKVVKRDGHDLLLANLLLQSRGMVDEARRRVQETLDRRAWELVDNYTWAAGAAAAVAPMVLDVLLSSGIAIKMVVDLARVYRQDVDMNLATKLVASLGKNLVAILGVNAAAPAIAAGIAGMLKTVPVAGTIAGGALQGIVQALVIRWVGAVFIGYFKSEMKQPEAGLANLARREWQRLTAPAELLKFVQTARDKIRGTITAEAEAETKEQSA
jgi:uncharacterized protein